MNTRPLRADAARNRARVIEAATEVLAEKGLDASIPEIAERAGVGVATIYRGFPTKRDLVEAIVAERFLAFEGATDDALTSDDPWAAFKTLLHVIAEMQVDNRAFGQIIGEVFHMPQVRVIRDRTLAGMGELMARAQASGQLRPDVSPQDIPLLMSGLANSLSSVDRSGRVWERHLSILIDGLRAEGANALPRPPVDAAGLDQLAQELHARRRDGC